MKKNWIIAIGLLGALGVSGCNQSKPNPREAQVEAHLERIEGHLARIEEALVKQAEASVATQAAQTAQAAAEAAAPAAPAEPQEISVFVYGEAVTEPGEKSIREGSTVVSLLAAVGVYGEFKPRDVTVTRPQQPDAVLDREDQWKSYILEMGDVVTIRSAVF